MTRMKQKKFVQFVSLDDKKKTSDETDETEVWRNS